MTMQGKILAEIHRILKEHNLEAVESWDYVYKGTIYVQPEGILTTAFLIHLDFQPRYFGACISAPLDPPRSEKFGFMPYDDYELMDQFLTVVERYAIDPDALKKEEVAE